MRLRKKELEDQTDLIYNKMRDRIFYKPRWEAPDLKPVSPAKQVNRGRSLLFSGNRKDPEVYLQWESDMEEWLKSNNLPKELELTQVVSAFTGKAREWWQKESTPTLYKKSVTDWRDLKALMHKEFVEKYQATPTSVTSTSPSDQEYEIKRHEEDIEDPIQQTTCRSEGDIRPINEAYKTDLEDLSNELRCSRNLTHQGVIEKKNWSKSFPNEEVIQLSSGQISNESEGDQRLLIRGFQTNQDEKSCKPTSFGNLILHRSMESWNHVQIPYGLKVIQLLNQEVLSLPYLEAHRFKHLQTRLWRPGETYDHSEDISSHPGESYIILEGSDLRTNPFKGGGDGVIRISLNFKDLKVNHESSNQDHFPQSTRYDGHFGRANTHLFQDESRDGRNSLLIDRSELVRPPEQLQKAMIVFDEPRHVSAHLNTRDKAQKAQEGTKDELGLIMEKSKRVFNEQSPFWPIKLKDKPPWAIFMYLGFNFIKY